MSLDTRLTIRLFATLAKTAEARIEGGRIIGRFSNEDYLEISPKTPIAERFANCRSDQTSIARFTRTYGPLDVDAVPGASFDFSIADWERAHIRFRRGWELCASFALEGKKKYGIAPATTAPVVPLLAGTFLRFGPGGTVLLLPNLKTLIDVCFGASPLERFRICPSPGCDRRYFVAHHLKQTLCGAEACEAWNVKRLKREYWEREKGAILAERKRKRKEGSNVAKKAR